MYQSWGRVGPYWPVSVYVSGASGEIDSVSPGAVSATRRVPEYAGDNLGRPIRTRADGALLGGVPWRRRAPDQALEISDGACRVPGWTYVAVRTRTNGYRACVNLMGRSIRAALVSSVRGDVVLRVFLYVTQAVPQLGGLGRGGPQ